MRGKIIQYNGTEGRGVIIAEGSQYPFTITSWTSESVSAMEIAEKQDVRLTPNNK